MQRIILNTSTNYKRQILTKDDDIDLPDNIAGRWVRFRIAHYPEKQEKSKPIPIGVCKSTSIIMLSRDCLEYTKKCLDSLALYTSNFELIIIDNGSSKETVDYLKRLKKFKDCKLVLNDKNMGVPYGWDQGIKLAKHDYVAFINNDVIFTPDWLYHLQKCFEDNLDCAVASPTTCFLSGLQCDWKLAPKRFEMSQADINRYAEGLEFGYIDTKIYGFCFLTHRKVIDKIGVFDYKRYGLGTAEEADFNWRAKQIGFKTYWVKHTYVHHYGHITFEKGNTGLVHNQLCRANRVIFDSRVRNDKNLFVENDVDVEAIEIPEFSKSIDVIIPVLDRQEETTAALKSLFKQNKNINVTIIDNGSDNLDYLKQFDVKVIKNKENIGVVKAINIGLELAKSKYIVVMHNDVVIGTKDWIDKATKFMDSNDDVGMVGTSGWTEIKSNGDHNNIVSGISAYNYKFKSDFIEVAVTDGQCNIIKNIGLALDEDYGFMHFYDKDMSFQYRQQGYKSYVMKTNITHVADDRNLSTVESKKYKSRINDHELKGENKKKFTAKWKNIIPIKVVDKDLIPILMTTYNRLPYTKRAVKALLKNTEEVDCEIFIFDNNSTDGTKEYLKSIKDERVTIHLNAENEGIIKPKNIFLERYKDCKYCAFVDNDSIVPKGWIRALKAVMDKFPLIAVQLEHYVGLGWDFKENIDWFKHLYHIDFNGHNLYLSNSIGGSGELVRRQYITSPIPEAKGTLGGWVSFLRNRFNKDNLISAFYDGLFMELCDMVGTNQKIYEFDDYKKELNGLGRGDFGWAKFSEKDKQDCKRLKKKIGSIVKEWN